MDGVIEVWLHHYGFPESLDGMRELAEAFHRAHPGHRVQIRGFDYRELPAAVARAAEQGAAPAVAQYFYTGAQVALDMRTASGAPLFASVEAEIAGRTEILGEPVVVPDLLPAVRDYYTLDGDLVAMPMSGSSTVLYSNMAMLGAAGIARPPQTWDELVLACKALARNGSSPAHGITWPNHGWIFQQAVASQGGLLAELDNGRGGRARRVDLVSPQLMDFVRWWRQLHQEGHYLYTGTQGDDTNAMQVWEDNYAAFAAGRVAFVQSSSVEAERMVGAGAAAGFAVRASRIPYNAAVPFAGNIIGGDALWLRAGLDPATRDTALAFMQYLHSPALAAERHKTGHYLPSTLSAVGLLDRQGWFADHPHRRVAVDQLALGDRSAAARGAVLGGFAEIQILMVRAMHDVLTAGADPLARFTEAGEQAHRLLDDYHAGCGAAASARASRSPVHLLVG